MNTTPAIPSAQKPDKVQTIAIMTLISGISNILWMIFWAFFILVGGIASVGIGCLFLPIVIPPIVLGVFEIIYSTKLLPTPAIQTRPSQTLAILEIICVLTGNVISLVAGILAIVSYGDSEVKTYFARLNGQI